MSRDAPGAQRNFVAYPPAIAELETSRRSRLIDLSTQVSCEAAVTVHHCKDMSAMCVSLFPLLAQYSRSCFNQLSTVFFSAPIVQLGRHVLCLSHWSTECLGLLPPF